jgi:hypothetical protein
VERGDVLLPVVEFFLRFLMLSGKGQVIVLLLRDERLYHTIVELVLLSVRRPL